MAKNDAALGSRRGPLWLRGFWPMLKHVFESYVRSGMPSKELPIAADTFLRLDAAQDIPVQQNLGKATLSELGSSGFVLDFQVGAD